MTARVRLLALDIDGTLLGGDKRISPRTLKAVTAARALGDPRVRLLGEPDGGAAAPGDGGIGDGGGREGVGGHRGSP